MAETMAKNAKNGTCIINGIKYNLNFVQNGWVYNVTDNLGNTIVTFNTKNLSQAKKWFRDWMNSSNIYPLRLGRALQCGNGGQSATLVLP